MAQGLGGKEVGVGQVVAPGHGHRPVHDGLDRAAGIRASIAVHLWVGHEQGKTKDEAKVVKQ